MAENWKEAGMVLMRSAGQESNINLPNVLTLVRILLIPVFIMLLIDPTPDRALAAAVAGVSSLCYLVIAVLMVWQPGK